MKNTRTKVRRKKKKLEMSQDKEDPYSNLPMDLFFDIFSRLPLKTISQCRWVSKTWYKFILHPEFAKSHHARALQNQSTSPCVVFRGWYKKFHLLDPDCLENLHISVTAYPLVFREFKENFEDYDSDEVDLRYYGTNEVVGSVNGLICFYTEFGDYLTGSPYYICNPITGDYALLPKSPKYDIDRIASGFGFDSNTNEYKVLRILWESENEANIECEIYTLGSGNWRSIPINVPYIACMQPSSVLVSGCLHWVTYMSRKSPYYAIILSFNVAKEEFNILRLPSYLEQSLPVIDPLHTIEGLMVLEDCLCLIVSASLTDSRVRLHVPGKLIWMMNDHGVHDSWVKLLYSIQNEFIHTPTHGAFGMIELWNGLIVLLDDDFSFGYYDLQTKEYWRIDILNVNNESVGEIDLPIFLSGSLLSPKHIEHQ